MRGKLSRPRERCIASGHRPTITTPMYEPKWHAGPALSAPGAAPAPLGLEFLHDLQELIVYLFVLRELHLDVTQVGEGIVGSQLATCSLRLARPACSQCQVARSQACLLSAR